jgi:hypothetical protein
MAVTAPPAYPFVEVKLDLAGLKPIAQRAPGVIAVVGTAGTGTANEPTEIGDSKEAKDNFGATGSLQASLNIALAQDPRPSKIYGVKADQSGTNPPDYAAALSSIEGVDDITMVSLASEPGLGTQANPRLLALLNHVESASADGNRRIGFAMVDPDIAKEQTGGYAAKVESDYKALKTDKSRMVLVGARGAKTAAGQTPDVATATMAAVAGYRPHISAVLKQVSGFSIPPKARYNGTEVKALSSNNMIPVLDPALIPGEGLFLGEGRCYTTKEELLYIDLVRTLDQIEFELKAGLIGSIGDARITKAGMMAIRLRTEAILGLIQRREMIDAFKVVIPVLDALLIPESARSGVDKQLIQLARQTRQVEMNVEITYGPAVHNLIVNLSPVFA